MSVYEEEAKVSKEDVVKIKELEGAVAANEKALAKGASRTLRSPACHPPQSSSVLAPERPPAFAFFGTLTVGASLFAERSKVQERCS
mmetsp:Transcript_27475/g.63865  ORF Transcript_27475/g.63865 Transcript_27475/m.63865 type:complete len:87 (+) Transcript_27475:221-481(+)